MALKFKIKSREEVPAELQSLYVERDGAFVLDAEGVVEKTKLDEFRTGNVALRKELEEFKTRFDGIDPDEVRQLAEAKRKLELQAQGHKPEELDRLVGERIKGLKADWDKQLSTVTGERDSLTSRLTAIQIDQGVLTVATKRGLRPTAIQDITAHDILPGACVGAWITGSEVSLRHLFIERRLVGRFIPGVQQPMGFGLVAGAE